MKKIAVLAGDGIGPEIMAQALKVLTALKLPLEFEEALVGGVAYAAFGHPLPTEVVELAKKSDAVLFGAVGDFKYDNLPRHLRPEQAILGLRKALGLFVNLRPAICYPELTAASSLKPELVSGLDLLLVRELTGDVYFGQPRGKRISLTALLPVPKKALTQCATPFPKWKELPTLLLKLLWAAANILSAWTKPTF